MPLTIPEKIWGAGDPGAKIAAQMHCAKD